MSRKEKEVGWYKQRVKQHGLTVKTAQYGHSPRTRPFEEGSGHTCNTYELSPGWNNDPTD